MSLVSSDYCYCTTGYGVLVEAGSGNIDRPHDRLPQADHALNAGRITTGLQRMLAVFTGRMVAGGKRAA